MGLKITVIGGGSSYTPELFANLIELINLLEVDQVTLMDRNPQKLEFVSEVCQRLVDRTAIRTRIQKTTALEQALAGADFVLLQIRVGGLPARIRDETIPQELGMVGNETTGAGGFACALRTVPVALEVAHLMERIAPRAWLLNLSNPAGIVTEAILKHSTTRTIGFCNIPINTTYCLAEIFGVQPSTIQLDSFGLNHLSWVRGAFVEGEEKLQPMLVKTMDREAPLYRYGAVDKLIDPAWLRNLGMLPGWYLRYFYYPEVVIEKEKQESVKGKADLRAEERLREVFSRSGYDQEARSILESKGGARYYLPVLQVIQAIVENSEKIVVVDVQNQGAIPDLPGNGCVEVPARIAKGGATPLPTGPLPPQVKGLVQTVKAYEELTVEAAVHGDRQAAIAALMTNPLVGTYRKASQFFERVLLNENDYLKPFFDKQE